MIDGKDNKENKDVFGKIEWYILRATLFIIFIIGIAFVLIISIKHFIDVIRSLQH